MGITVVWETEDGTSLGSAGDPCNLLHTLLPDPKDISFQILRFIDRYGDTVINRLQLEPFVQEWERLARSAKTQEEKAFVSRVRALATQCQQLHTYLKLRRLSMRRVENQLVDFAGRVVEEGVAELGVFELAAGTRA